MPPPTRVKAFDVWFVAANTVYKQVPYHVVADWAAQGRLAAADMVRPGGSAVPWARVDANPLLADYLPAAAPAVVAVGPGDATAEPVEHDLWDNPSEREEEDDEVDMIPLIDISMVLLVFFIMTQAASAVSSVAVPDMVFAGALSKNAKAITVVIDKAPGGVDAVTYSVRIGETPPKPGHDNLATPDAAVAAVEALLPDVARDTKGEVEVRIACRKDLPSERVFEILVALKPRKDSGQIKVINAEVHEAKRQ